MRVREDCLPKLLAVAHGRFDVALFIWQMEVSLPLPVVLYDFLLKNMPDGEEYYQVLQWALFECTLRQVLYLHARNPLSMQRKNYPAALMRKLSTMKHLESSGHDLARVLKAELRGGLDEAWGEHGESTDIYYNLHI